MADSVDAELFEAMRNRIAELEEAIAQHRRLAYEERTCCIECLSAGKEPWSPKRDTELWRHVDG